MAGDTVMKGDTPGRSFVPRQLNPDDFDQFQPLFDHLLSRPISSSADLERWLLDLSELMSVLDECGSRRYIDKSCHTDDPAIEQRYLHFVENIEPRTKPLFFRLQQRFLDSPHRHGLSGRRYELLARKWQADVDVFRDTNVPLETQLTRLVTDYDKLCGAMMVQFRGRECTLQQMARFQEETDRATRQEAWELVATRRLDDRPAIDALFDQQLSLRQQIARNADLDDYRAFAWKLYKRFDYKPEDCLRFADAIANICVPLVEQLNRQRAADLGLPRLRPWDLDVDPKGRPPLRPFTEDQVPQFIVKTREIFYELNPRLAMDFDQLRQRNHLDLDSRKGKQPGGYQCALEESRQPFIFMNAAGLHRDVETLLHEGGHAFHYLASRHEPLVFLRSAPMEFCEVASMSMELLGSEHFDIFYQAEELARARRKLLEGIVRFFPWMATIDSFQHWLYTHPGHTQQQRTIAWTATLDRFAPDLDWSGYDNVRQSQWQRQLHLFHAPFYYVEYGIAQLGALQLWLKSKEDPRKALSLYRSALALGGTCSLPELFAAAGLRFDFSAQTLRPLIHQLWEDLETLPT